MCKTFLCFFVILFFVTGAVALKFVEKNSEKPLLQVQTSTGIVQGTRLSSQAIKRGYYYAYLGIPYAEPPIGYLRFRAPKWAKKWSGVLDGSREGEGCVEIQVRLAEPAKVIGSEDCLFINVYTKYNPKKNRQLRPVMVFMYGGAFVEGQGEFASYGPEIMVSKDVILIHFNYRTGPLGFLSTEDMASPGNYGLKDQNLALRWIQRNIKRFGGDPDNVTIFGQSAGSVSVSFHLLSPKSRGLFRQAIMESGTVLCHWGCQTRPRNIAALLGVANGIVSPKSSQELVEKLRKLNIEDLKSSLLAHILVAVGFAPVTGLPYSPTIEPDHEDAFISQEYWYDLLKNGEFNQVPVLMGLNSNESLFFQGVFRVVQPLLVTYDVDPSFLTPPSLNISDQRVSLEIGKMVRDRYIEPGNSFARADLTKILWYVSQNFFLRPIVKTANLMSKYVPLFLYYFSYEGDLGVQSIHVEGQHPNFKGVGHVEELYYLFTKMGVTSNIETDLLVRSRMVTLWTNFAKFGHPTPQKEQLLNNIIWPKTTPSSDSRLKYLEINETLTIRDIFNEQADIDWWEDIFRKYGNPPFWTY